ncbi:MAG: universal stress protein [Caldilineaceae bacterium]|nr:universal stress protein [Caldilineaceae bacterium]
MSYAYQPVTFSKVMLTLDGSGVSRQAAPQAVAIANRFGGRLILYSVIHNPHSVVSHLPLPSTDVDALGAGIDRRLHAEAERIETVLRSLVEELGMPPARVDVVVEAHTDAAESITAYAADNEVDLIVMATHGRSGLGRTLRGSVAESVLRQAHCPVMLIRATEVKM